MSLKVRLARGGAKKDAHYKVVVTEITRSRDGKVVDTIGHYHPSIHEDESKRFIVNAEKLAKWIACGAKPTDVVTRLCLSSGISDMKKFVVKRTKSENYGKTRKEIKSAESAKASASK